MFSLMFLQMSCFISTAPTRERQLKKNTMSISLRKPSPSRKCNTIQIQKLKRRRLSKEAKEGRKKLEVLKRKMLFKNFKLYLENQNIIEKNEKLREKAALLIKENQELLSQFQNLSHHQHHLPSNMII